MKNNQNNLFKIVFVWGAIIAGVLGAILHIGWLIIIAAIMLAAAFIYIRYITMKEMIDRRKNKEKEEDKINT